MTPRRNGGYERRIKKSVDKETALETQNLQENENSVTEVIVSLYHTF
jgi:hypothetical protein